MADPNDETIPYRDGDRTDAEAAIPEAGAEDASVASPKLEESPPASGISADLVGKQLGDFRVLRRLGAGGMAEVFLAEQVSLKRPVALKILKPELLVESDDTHLKRFAQEATAAANLNHPHIVQVHAIGEHEGLHYIAQEYVPGLTLRQWLRKSGPPEPLRAIRLLRQVARALQAADDAGIVHRDIKPENILLSKKLDAKVADFGLAQLSQTDERVQLTQVGITMGTPLYMSPEQVAGKPLDHRSDIYSLGVTAYQLLTGSPPFQGETALSVAVQHLNVAPEPLRRMRPDLPVALCELIERMMEKRPEARYQHASEIVEDLGRLGAAIKKNPSAAMKLGLVTFSVARRTPAGRWPLALDQFFNWSGRRHAIALGGMSLLIFLGALGAGWFSRPANPFDSKPPIHVAKADSAREQYFNAIFSGNSEAYAAVREYWPNEHPWVSSATIRLALIRLSERDLAGARELFRELAASENEQARIDGQTGLALIAAFNPDSTEFRQRLATINIEESHRDLQRLLLGMRDHRGVSTEVQTLLNEMFPPEETEAAGMP